MTKLVLHGILLNPVTLSSGSWLLPNCFQLSQNSENLLSLVLSRCWDLFNSSNSIYQKILSHANTKGRQFTSRLYSIFTYKSIFTCSKSTLRFSDVFGGYGKGALETNGITVFRFNQNYLRGSYIPLFQVKITPISANFHKMRIPACKCSHQTSFSILNCYY